MFRFFGDSCAFHLGCAWFTVIHVLTDAGLSLKYTPSKCYPNCKSNAFYPKCCRDCLFLLFLYEVVSQPHKKIMPRTFVVCSIFYLKVKQTANPIKIVQIHIFARNCVYKSTNIFLINFKCFSPKIFWCIFV